MKKTLKIMSVVIDVLAFVFNMLMLVLYVYALSQGYVPKELNMAWQGVLHGICINGAWAIKMLVIRITKIVKWFKARRK